MKTITQDDIKYLIDLMEYNINNVNMCSNVRTGLNKDEQKEINTYQRIINFLEGLNNSTTSIYIK